MIAGKKQVHEAEAELLSAEEAIQDAEQLRALFNEQQQVEQPIPVRIPLSILLDALDELEPELLRLVVRRAEERLSLSGQRG